MDHLDLPPVAQQGLNVILIWIGLGVLAGLLAVALIPSTRKIGPVALLLIGVLGSVFGIFSLSLFYKGTGLNPISLPGILSSAAGAAFLLIVYRVNFLAVPESTIDDSKETET